MTGTVTFGGTCTAATCFTSILAFPMSGQITWGGTLGSFSVSATVGTTKPATDPSNPELDVSLQRLTANSGGGGGTLTIQWTDTGFQPAGVLTATTSAGGIFSGNANVVLKTYIDNTNAAFGTATQVGIVGPFHLRLRIRPRTAETRPAQDRVRRPSP